MKKIATLAETYFVPLAPHCGSTILGLSASLHVAAAIPFFLIHEGNVKHNPMDITNVTWTTDKDGNVKLPQGPGLGVDIDEITLAKVDANPKKYHWPSGKYPDGSIADY